MKFLGYSSFNIDVKTIGDQLRNHRLQNGLSQKKLAKLLDVDPSTLASWEQNKRSPNMKKVEMFLKELTWLQQKTQLGCVGNRSKNLKY